MAVRRDVQGQSFSATTPTLRFLLSKVKAQAVASFISQQILSKTCDAPARGAAVVLGSEIRARAFPNSP
jgi:hypothetical protein